MAKRYFFSLGEAHADDPSYVLHYNIEPAHNKTYNKTCATSEDSDQPAHLRSLIEVFAERMCLLQPQGYSKRNK